jgi:hypothetical protein
VKQNSAAAKAGDQSWLPPLPVEAEDLLRTKTLPASRAP